MFNTMWQQTTSKKYAKFAWFVLAYTLFVIVWGAYVRATGSGAGCGSHWPACNGEVLHRPQSVETMIELTHRITSAFLGVLTIGMVWWSQRIYGWKHRVTKGAIWTLIFTIIEGLLGAGLVLFELVADNASSARALAMGVHLMNTLVLVAIMTVTAWWASGGPAVSLRGENKPITRMLGIGFFLLMIVGAFGAVTALGDTLFPAESFAEGAAAKLDPNAHFSVRARLWHPTLAVGTSIYLLVILLTVDAFKATAQRHFLMRLNVGLIIAQLAVGVVNVLLAAPVWMQLVHLLMADVTWISLLLLGMSTLEVEAHPAEESKWVPVPDELRQEKMATR